jgi:hypothetical protein
MDDKTAELRDIFVEATGAETVTERQAESRGSLVDAADDERIDTRLRDLLATMRERYDFETDLDPDAYVRLIRGFHAGESDAALAAAVGDADGGGDAVDTATVVRARLDCHLVRATDRDHPDFAAIRERVLAGADDAAVATACDCDPETVAARRRVIETDREITRANGRFRDAFADLLTDADLTDRLASDSREDGLTEATEDIETDVSF